MSSGNLPSLEDPLPEGQEKAASVQALFDTIAPRYDMVNRLMTFRLDVRWRRIALDALALTAGDTVVDLACGTGDLCKALAERELLPIGVDFSLGMLQAAQTDAPFVQGDGMSMPFPDGAVDGVSCGFALRNFVDLSLVFSELARIVVPGGRIALLDASAPDNKVAASLHGFYFNKVVPLIGGALSNKEAYGYLPRSLAYLPEREVMLAMLNDAGFVDVSHRQLTLGAAQLITATRREA